MAKLVSAWLRGRFFVCRGGARERERESPLLESNDLELLVLPLLAEQVLVLVEERDERGAEALVRRVDQLLAGLLAPLDGALSALSVGMVVTACALLAARL